MSHRKICDYWTETHRVIGGEVKVTTCCCSLPGASGKQCGKARLLKTPCRCFCHANSNTDCNCNKRKGVR